MLAHAARLLLNTLRSIPDLVWGIMFVAAVGFGPLPGLLALACHSTGMLGKFYAEIIEHVDTAPGEALRSHGVSRLAVLRFSVLPQILPRVVDVTLYRWEHNVRAATVLGVIGAGGIGLGTRHRLSPVRLSRGDGANSGDARLLSPSSTCSAPGCGAASWRLNG